MNTAELRAVDDQATPPSGIILATDPTLEKLTLDKAGRVVLLMTVDFIGRLPEGYARAKTRDVQGLTLTCGDQVVDFISLRGMHIETGKNRGKIEAVLLGIDDEAHADLFALAAMFDAQTEHRKWEHRHERWMFDQCRGPEPVEPPAIMAEWTYDTPAVQKELPL